AAGPLTSPVTVFTYDAVGNLVTVTDARGNITTSVYDPQDRLVESIGPDPDAAGPLPAPVTRYTYDLAGNLEAMTDPNGNTTEYEYDSRNRRIAMTDPDGGVTQFGYDIDNNLAQVTDPVGNITRFAYDARSRLIEETDPLGATITYTYDAADNLAAKLDRNGRVTRFTYDEIDRLLTEEWLAPDDSVVNTVSYTYDAASNLLSLADNQSALAFTYDARNRVQTVDNLGTPGVPNVVLTYTYDDVSNVLTVSDTIDGGPGATTGYQYDGLNRLVSLNQSGANTSAKRVDFTYNPLGQYAAIDRFSDLAGTQIVIGTDYTYDAQNRLTRLDHQNAQGQSVAFYDYLYDAASRITQITDVDGVTSYGYDDRDQLTSADYTDLTRTDESYQYDANGNRVQSSQHGSGYVTGPANRLLSDGTYTYEYDAEGNMLRRTRITGAEPDGSTTREFTWDHRNRLIAIVDTLADGTPTQEVEFTYDTLNRRIGKAVDTTPLDAVNAPLEIFIYDREDIVVELEDFDGSSSALPQLVLRYLHGPLVDQVLTQDNSLEASWLLTNHLGTTTALVTSSGVVDVRFAYDSFGQSIADSQSVTTRYLYTGREVDEELGLVYSRARYLDPSLGVFLGEDPLGLQAGMNPRQYVYSNPVSLIDPFGLDAACYVDFPDYRVSGYDTLQDILGPFGHAGVLGYDESGKTQYYEYGRYPTGIGDVFPQNDGNIRKLPNVPDLQLGPDGRPTKESLQKLLSDLSKRAGKGTTPKLSCETNNVDVDKLYEYLKNLAGNANRPKYSVPNQTCKTVAKDAIDASKKR
ncbi:MAG: RHS repeat-associated core domain-containing protein, partial [Planctomycetaceae bacterium]